VVRTRPDLRILSDTLVRLIRPGALAGVQKLVSRTHVADLAAILHRLKVDEQRTLWQVLFEMGRLGAMLACADESHARRILEEMSDEQIAQMLLGVSDDEAADLVGYLSEDRARRVIELLVQQGGADLLGLLAYDVRTAGGRLSREFFALKQTMTVGEAIERLRSDPLASRGFYLYVVDDAGHLRGVISMRALLLAQPDVQLSEVMSRDVVHVNTHTPQEEVASIVAKYDLLALPVVDEAGVLVRVITVDDVIDVITDEVTDDIYRMAGSSPEELVYGNQITKIARVRLPWLIVNLFGGMVSGLVLYFFRRSLEEAIVLASFVPVIAGMGGNIGTQSASITVRGLAVGRISLDRIWAVVSKEVRVGALMGSICGGIVGIIGGIWKLNPYLGLVVGISMFCSITVAALMGTLAPATFKRIGVDPAVASGPFVTTANDITGLLIYLSLATLLLPHLR